MSNKYFEVMTSVVNKKRIPEEDILAHFNGWNTMSWLSSNPRAVHEINLLNSCRGNKYIGKLQEYKMLRGLVNIPKNSFINKDKVDKNQKVIIDVIRKHFKVGKMTALDYYKILKGEQIISILELYARKNETHFKAKDMKIVTDIRAAITAKKKILREKV